MFLALFIPTLWENTKRRDYDGNLGVSFTLLIENKFYKKFPGKTTLFFCLPF